MEIYSFKNILIKILYSIYKLIIIKLNNWHFNYYYCIILLNLFVHNYVVLFNDILDSFAEGNEFLQRYVICIKSIELNKEKLMN